MFKLTEKRLAAAESIFERYRDELLTKRTFSACGFEADLRRCWKIGYQDMKAIMIQILKTDRYSLVAAFFMEQGSPGVVCEFQIPLAKLYGASRFNSPDWSQKRDEFWERAYALENLSDEQKDLLLRLGPIEESPEKVFKVETLEELEHLRLVYRREDGPWDYTDDGEEMYSKLLTCDSNS